MLMILSMIILRCCWGPTDYQLMLANQNDDTILKEFNGTYQINTLNYADVSSYNLSIAFDDDTKKVSGFSGCNRFFGSYTLNNDVLKFENLGTTKMLCSDEANKIAPYLTGDDEVYDNPEKYFDQVIEINLSELGPLLNGPFTPDLATPIAEMGAKADQNDWPRKVEWGLIGSCTNSSYEDMSRAASIVEQAVKHGIKPKAEFGINPGSEQVRYTIARDGIIET